MLTVDEKKEVCEWFTGLEGTDKETIRDFCKIHKLKRSTFFDALQKYKRLRDQGVDTCYD